MLSGTRAEHRLEGKVAVVTGASRGLGRRVAAALAAEGAEVALLSRSAPELEVAASEIGAAARAYPVDITDSVAVDGVFAQLADRHGRVDVLVNNAALARPHTIDEVTDEDLLSEVVTNLVAPVYCIRAAVPLMRAAGGGDVITISSVSVRNPFPTLWFYAATKAGMEKLSEGLSTELRADRIRMSVLRSGGIADSTFHADWDDERRERADALALAAGRADFMGDAPVSAELMAQWVVEIATLPRDARVELLELRPR